MEYTNKLTQYAREHDGVDHETLKDIARLLAPFTPHMAEELWSMLGATRSIFESGWPEYDLEKMKEDQLTMPIQINGKVRSTIQVSVDATKEEILEQVRAEIGPKLEGKTVVKEIVVPKKIINIVVK